MKKNQHFARYYKVLGVLCVLSAFVYNASTGSKEFANSSFGLSDLISEVKADPESGGGEGWDWTWPNCTGYRYCPGDSLLDAFSGLKLVCVKKGPFLNCTNGECIPTEPCPM